MTWHVDFSTDSLKFLKKNNLDETFVIDKVKLAVRKFSGEDININIKRLSGKWQGFYRIRSGKVRIIADFKFDSWQAYVEVIDWRGSVYK